MSWTTNIRTRPHYDIIDGKLVFIDSRGYVSIIGQWCWL